MSERYQDIIDLPHHVSPKRQAMSLSDRAAQFAPFSALTGYDDVIIETGRLTDCEIDQIDDMRELLDLKQRYLAEIIESTPEITVTFFVDDTRKSGGAYRTVTGCLKRIEEHERVLLFTDGNRIPMDRILRIDSPILGDMELFE